MYTFQKLYKVAPNASNMEYLRGVFMSEADIAYALIQKREELIKEKESYKKTDNPSIYFYDCLCERIRTLQDVINFINYHTW